MIMCPKCKIVFGEYNTGKHNPNGEYVGVKTKKTNWEWKIKCPHCGTIDNKENF